MEKARELFRAAGGKGGVTAKIERAEALEAIESDIRASDAIVIARGDSYPLSDTTVLYYWRSTCRRRLVS